MSFLRKNNRIVKLAVFTALFAFTIIYLSACSKKEPNANARFIGTYQGNDCSGNALPNVVVTAGSNGSSIDITYTIDTGGCAGNIILVGSVSGNDATFPGQTFDDLCGNEVTVSGSGVLNGNTFTINLSGLSALSGSSSTVTSDYCFSGSK